MWRREEGGPTARSVSTPHSRPRHTHTHTLILKLPVSLSYEWTLKQLWDQMLSDNSCNFQKAFSQRSLLQVFGSKRAKNILTSLSSCLFKWLTTIWILFHATLWLPFRRDCLKNCATARGTRNWIDLKICYLTDWRTVEQEVCAYAFSAAATVIWALSGFKESRSVQISFGLLGDLKSPSTSVV